MEQKRTKLFVIIDPESTHQVALVKALLIAKLGNCHIHAFMCVYADIKDHPEASSRKGLKHRTLKDAEARLEELMKPCSFHFQGILYEKNPIMLLLVGLNLII